MLPECLPERLYQLTLLPTAAEHGLARSFSRSFQVSIELLLLIYISLMTCACKNLFLYLLHLHFSEMPQCSPVRLLGKSFGGGTGSCCRDLSWFLLRPLGQEVQLQEACRKDQLPFLTSEFSGKTLPAQSCP